MKHWRKKYSEGLQTQLAQVLAPGSEVAIHPVEPVRQPARAALEKHDAQLRVPLEHAAEHEPRAGGHLLEGVRHQVQDGGVARALAAERRERVRHALVHGDRNAQRFGALPEGLVAGALDRTPGVGIRTEKRAAKAESCDAALELGDRCVDVVEREQRDADQPLRIRATEVCEPIVVGATQSRVERRVRDLGEEEAQGRIQDADVDFLEVHVAQALLRIEATRRQAAILGLRTRRQRARDAHDEAVVDDVAELAVLVALRARGPPPEARLEILAPELRGLDHVPVGIDHERARGIAQASSPLRARA